jgi:hypothetical protein
MIALIVTLLSNSSYPITLEGIQGASNWIALVDIPKQEIEFEKAKSGRQFFVVRAIVLREFRGDFSKIGKKLTIELIEEKDARKLKFGRHVIFFNQCGEISVPTERINGFLKVRKKRISAIGDAHTWDIEVDELPMWLEAQPMSSRTYRFYCQP